MSANAEPMFVEERQRLILDQLRRDGRVSVKTLSDAMRVSAVTIRSDLRALEEKGLLARTYGGAVLPTTQQTGPERSFEVRLHENLAEKDAIAQVAAKLVKTGDSIALDASTTAYAITPYLKQFERLIVVTNSLMIAQSFLDSPHIRVLMPGGRLRRDSIALVGNSKMLPHIHLQVGFFGARGIAVETGVTDADPDEAEIKRAMMARCLKRVIVAHQDKWDKVAPFPLADIQGVHYIITTMGAPTHVVAAYRESGVTVQEVPV